MTWGEFVRKIIDKGIHDDDLIAYIDIDGFCDADELKVERDDTADRWRIT